MLQVLKIYVMTGFRLCSLIHKYPSEHFRCRLHKQESPFHSFSQYHQLLSAMLWLSTSSDPYKDIARTYSEMYWWTEIRHSRHNLEEIYKFLLHIKCGNNCSRGIICVTHRTETPSALNGKASFIGDDLAK
jgi:hypothetical protein